MGEIIHNFAAIHKNMAAGSLSMKLKTGLARRHVAEIQCTVLGRGRGRPPLAPNRYYFDIIFTCLVLTTKCTGIGRNVCTQTFSLSFLTSKTTLKNNKWTAMPRFLLGSNVATGICTKTHRSQEPTAENQAAPLHSQNKEHRKPRIAAARRLPSGYPETRGGARTNAAGVPNTGATQSGASRLLTTNPAVVDLQTISKIQHSNFIKLALALPCGMKVMRKRPRRACWRVCR
jgi:hypothetical protein